jgi:hypothetical protein
MLLSDLSVNPSLSPVIDFSVPYQTTNLAILVKVRTKRVEYAMAR